MRVVTRFKSGVTSFLDGARLLKRDRTIRALGLIPAFMSLTFFTAGLVVGMMYVDEIMSWVIQSNISDYNLFIKSLIYIASFVLLGFILYFVTFFVVSMLAVPVCSSLSLRVLHRHGILLESKKSLKENVITFARMLRISLMKLVFIVIISILLFVASFVPLISPIAIYLSLMILTFDCMDYAMEHDEQGLRARFKFFMKNWVEFSGFAVCMGVLLVIPFIHFILLPVAVLGTSILYSKIQKQIEA